jgi:hypothetical protein
VRLPRPRRPPVTAVEAYLALLDDLAGDAELARRSSETPRAHAGRLAGRPVARAGASRGRDGSPAVASLGVRRTTAPVDEEMLAADWAFAGRGGRGHLGDLAAVERAARAAGRSAGSAAGTPPPPPAADPATRRDLGLLVADWELARYAERRLTPREDARGVARWRRLRVALRRARPMEPPPA